MSSPDTTAGHDAAPPATSTMKTLAQALWFPTFFVVGFMVFYMLPFHAASPHDVPVAVVGQQAADGVAGALQQRLPGGFEISVATDAGAARQAVLDREVIAGYDPADRILFVAGADGVQLTQTVVSVFGPVARAGGTDLVVDDVAPAASGDLLGTALFYMAMAWNIAGYIVVMMLMQAVTLGSRQKKVAIVAFGAAATLVSWLFSVAVSAVGPDPTVLLVGFLLTQAVSWTTFGLAPFVRRALPGVAMSLFVLLSIPSSGGALPLHFVPGIFQALHHVMPLGNAIDAARDILYFGGRDVGRPVLVLLAWTAFGVALVVVADRRRAARKRAADGTDDAASPTDASTATAAAEDAAAVGGAHYGLEHQLERDLAARAHRELRPGLTGRIFDGSSRASAGATVTATDEHGRRLGSSTTDGAGWFHMALSGPVEVTLAVAAADHLPMRDRVLYRSGALHRDYQLASV